MVYVSESGVSSVPLKMKRLMKKAISAKSRAARTTIISISTHSGSAFFRNAVPAAPMRLDTTIDGITPVITVKMYFLYLRFDPLPK